MATMNPFDLLGDDDNDDPSMLIASVQKQKAADAAAAAAAVTAAKKGDVPASAVPGKTANFPSKPVAPQFVKEKTDVGRGGGRGGRGFGRGRGGGGYRDQTNNENNFAPSDAISGGYKPSDDKDGEKRGYGGPRPAYQGARRGGYNNGEAVEGERPPRREYERRGGYNNGEAVEGERPPRREYERRSGTGRGNGLKREGSGRANWGKPTEEIAAENEEKLNETEKSILPEKQEGEEEAGDASKENPVTETPEKEPEPEDKEMTLEEYEKVLEEKRKALVSQRAEERKVDLDKELKKMQVLSSKKTNDEIFAKLGADKEKRKDAGEKEEKTKKSLSINDFLKPADGEAGYYGGRGRGGRGGRGRGGYNAGYTGSNNVKAPSIADNTHFPSLGGK